MQRFLASLVVSSAFLMQGLSATLPNEKERDRTPTPTQASAAAEAETHGKGLEVWGVKPKPWAVDIDSSWQSPEKLLKQKDNSKVTSLKLVFYSNNLDALQQVAQQDWPRVTRISLEAVPTEGLGIWEDFLEPGRCPELKEINLPVFFFDEETPAEPIERVFSSLKQSSVDTLTITGITPPKRLERLLALKTWETLNLATEPYNRNLGYLPAGVKHLLLQSSQPATCPSMDEKGQNVTADLQSLTLHGVRLPRELQKATQLTALTLENYPLSSSGYFPEFHQLKGLPLQSLHIEGRLPPWPNGISAGAFLTESVNTQTLTHLSLKDLWEDQVSSNYGELFETLVTKGTFPQLTSLQLDGPIYMADLQVLAPSDPKNPGKLAPHAPMPQLQALSVNSLMGYQKDLPQAFEALKRLSTLTHMSIANFRFDGKTLEVISQFPTLTHLTLNYYVDQYELPSLRPVWTHTALTSLTFVCHSHEGSVEPEGLAATLEAASALGKIKNLRTVTVQNEEGDVFKDTTERLQKVIDQQVQQAQQGSAAAPA